MGFVSADKQTLVEAAGKEFAEFAALSARHGDGWGIATCNVEAHPELLVEPTRASVSKAFDQASHNLKSSGALLHLRWATGGLAINEGNTHPFTYCDYSFTHNGALLPPESIDPFIDPKWLFVAGRTIARVTSISSLPKSRSMALRAACTPL